MPAPATYARRYTGGQRKLQRSRAKAPMAEPKNEGTYLSRQIDKVHAAATSSARSSFQNRGKKSSLSSAFIDDADDDDLDVLSIVGKEQQSASNTLESLRTLPTNLTESSSYDWLKPKAADVGDGKIGLASQIVKQKRPGKSSGSTDTMVTNNTTGTGANSLEILNPAEFVKRKRPGKNAGRMDVGYITNKNDTNTEMSIQDHHVYTDASQPFGERSQFPVQASDAMDTDADRAAEDSFDQDMQSALLHAFNRDAEMSYHAEEESEEE